MYYQSTPPIGNVAGMANAQFFKGPQYGQAFDAIAMDPREKAREDAIDRMLLNSLQKGEMGQGPLIDKAIQDLIQRTSRVRGV